VSCYGAPVIRNVVMIQLKPESDRALVAEIQDIFGNLNVPGTVNFTLGDDLGLRDGNWSFAIVSDHADADAYRAYDRDEAHNAARARLAPLIAQAARVQFEIPAARRAHR